jgi:tetratricopeptide (TPR) repeat protein
MDNPARKILSSLQTFTQLPTLRAMDRLRRLNSSEIRSQDPQRNRKNRQGLVLSTGFLVIVLVVLTFNSLASTMHLRNGIDAYERKQLDRAVSELTDAMAGNQSALPHYYRALTYQIQEKNVSAMEDLNYVVSHEPKNSMAWLTRACQHLKMSEHVEAIQDATQSISLEPKAAGSYLVRAAAELNTGQYQECIADCHSYLSRAGKSSVKADRVNAFNMIAASYVKLQKFDDAKDAYAIAISLDPSNQRLYSDRARLLQRKGDIKEAIADCNRALGKSAPSDILLLKAALCRANHQPALALATLNAAVKAYPKDVELRHERGSLELSLHNYAQAYADLKFVRDTCPGNSKAQVEFQTVAKLTPAKLRD